ncbi:MAG: glucoamylase family protein [Bacteroidota bacterium]
MRCSSDDEPEQEPGILQLSAVRFGTTSLSPTQVTSNVPLASAVIISFNLPLDRARAESAITLTTEDNETSTLDFSYLDNDKTISFTPTPDFQNGTDYTITIDEIVSTTGEMFPGAEYQFTVVNGSMDLVEAKINGMDLRSSQVIQNIPKDINVNITFSEKLSTDHDFSQDIRIGSLDLNFTLSEDQKSLAITSNSNVPYLTKLLFNIDSDLISEDGFVFEGFQKEFYTQLDSTFKFPELSDDDLLTKIQEQTFKYFWDFAHPVSGLARERNTSGNLVTIGGSGFGVMAILVGIERGFITREQGVNRLETIVNFLETADRFHGVWPHWMEGDTGNTIPFSPNDNGADLVETAFMIQGLLTAKQYLNGNDVQELAIQNKITTLWEEVEWDWFTQGGQDVLYWHWSPNFEWEKNLRISGWNESLIIYVLAAASPTHSISADVYNNGWARNGNMVNGNDFYDINLPLGSNRGGPLFFSHYSFLGLDPRNLEDQYADYWQQNISHSLINRAYCIDNPLNYVGYSTACWGLTASDGNEGYSAHSPNNDRGVITPTAAVSALPYAPDESIEAIKHFYYLLGDKLWGEYGFYDAFNITENWYARSYLAIDQGPIILMIENHRTALLWDLFMQNTEVTEGLDKLGFTSY